MSCARARHRERIVAPITASVIRFPVPVHPERAEGPPVRPGEASRLAPVYVRGSTTCPCCHASSWYVGRHVAECARCETVLPLAEAATFHLIGKDRP